MGLIKQIAEIFSRPFNREDAAEKTKKEICLYIEDAKKEWEDARNLFNEIKDPDLIDYAVYAIQAAEKKYIYLYKQAKSDVFTRAGHRG